VAFEWKNMSTEEEYVRVNNYSSLYYAIAQPKDKNHTTIVLQPGSYRGEMDFQMDFQIQSPMTIIGNDNVIYNNINIFDKNVVLENFTVENAGITVHGGTTTMKNIKVQGCMAAGIHINPKSNVICTDVTVNECYDSGIYAVGSQAESTTVWLLGNTTVANNGRNGSGFNPNVEFQSGVKFKFGGIGIGHWIGSYLYWANRTIDTIRESCVLNRRSGPTTFLQEPTIDINLLLPDRINFFETSQLFALGEKNSALEQHKSRYFKEIFETFEILSSMLQTNETDAYWARVEEEKNKWETRCMVANNRREGYEMNQTTTPPTIIKKPRPR